MARAAGGRGQNSLHSGRLRLLTDHHRGRHQRTFRAGAQRQRLAVPLVRVGCDRCGCAGRHADERGRPRLPLHLRHQSGLRLDAGAAGGRAGCARPDLGQDLRRSGRPRDVAAPRPPRGRGIGDDQRVAGGCRAGSASVSSAGRAALLRAGRASRRVAAGGPGPAEPCAADGAGGPRGRGCGGRRAGTRRACRRQPACRGGRDSGHRRRARIPRGPSACQHQRRGNGGRRASRPACAGRLRRVGGRCGHGRSPCRDRRRTCGCGHDRDRVSQRYGRHSDRRTHRQLLSRQRLRFYKK